MRLAYSQAAQADLMRLREYIAKDDPAAASRIARDLVRRIEHLCEFPGMGRGVALAPDPDVVRDFSFGNYLVRYAVHPGAIVILRIWHHDESHD